MLNDLRFALRTLAKSPLFAAVCILSLGFGIGAASTMFNWMDRVLWRPLPVVAEQERLAGIVNRNAAREWISSSYPDYRDYRDRTNSFTGVLAFRWSPVFVGPQGETQRAFAQLVSGNYFDVLGVKAIAGRTFNREEQADKPGGAPVVVLSERYWARRYGRDPAILGSTIAVNRFPLRVIGVVPGEFPGTIPGLEFDLWFPLMMNKEVMGTYRWEDRGSRPLSMFGRLKPGVTVEQANAEVRLLGQNLERAYPRQNDGIAVEAVPVGMHPDGVQRLMREPLYALAALGGVILLLVCSNVGNLLLARAQNRRKEFAIRMGLGASAWQIARQMLAESLVLAFAGACVGLLMATWLGGALSLLGSPTDLPLKLEATFNLRLVAGAFTMALAAALLASVAPIVRWRKADARAGLAEGSRGATSSRGVMQWRSGLAAAEIALATVALVAGAVFWKSFEQARAFKPGFDPAGVVLAGLDPIDRDMTIAGSLRSLELARDHFAAMPGVEKVALVQHVPLGLDLGSWEVLNVEGYTPRKGEAMNIWRNVISPGYFDLMRIPLVAGRDFNDLDIEAKGTDLVAIVNETFARRYYAGQSEVLGRKFAMWGGRARMRIVGVVKDSKYQTIGEAPMPFFYIPIKQFVAPSSGYAVMMRIAPRPESMIEAVRQRGQGIDPRYGLIGPVTLEGFMGTAYLVQRAAASICSLFGIIATLLAAMGVYGVMAFAAGERRREIGIRLALGATPVGVFRLLARGGVAIMLAGTAIGLVTWLAAGPMARAILFGVDARDPLTIVPALLMLIAIVSLATCGPAWRAARIDPGVALRES